MRSNLSYLSPAPDPRSPRRRFYTSTIKGGWRVEAHSAGRQFARLSYGNLAQSEIDKSTLRNSQSSLRSRCYVFVVSSSVVPLTLPRLSVKNRVLISQVRTSSLTQHK